MEVYKLCDCGHLNIYEDTGVAPRRCEKCTRNVLHKSTLPLSTYIPETSSEEQVVAEATTVFILKNEEKDIVVELPTQEEFIIGRTFVGAGFLPSTVSRKHLYVTPKGGLGLIVIDKESLNGTLINNELLEKNVEKLVLPGTKIKLDINETGITFELCKVNKG